MVDFYTKYPEMFGNCYEVYIKDGWMPVIDATLMVMRDYCVEHKCGFPEFLQIKEKLASLRMYYTRTSVDAKHQDAIDAMILDCEVACSTTCEYTGFPGAETFSTPDGYWVKVTPAFAEEYGLTKEDVQTLSRPKLKALRCKFIQFRNKYGR